MKTDRIVVVTGAAGGMGRLAVQRFLANGDTVIATDVAADGLEELTDNEAFDAKLHTIVADISKEDDCAAVAAKAGEVGGQVDVLVNVAGYFPMQPFDEMTADDFRKVVDINLTGVFLMIKAMTPLLRGRGWGRIVIIGSASTFDGVASQVHYVAAKAGLFGLSRSLARVLGKDGITVNVVTPGLTSTPAVKVEMPPEMIERQDLRVEASRDHAERLALVVPGATRRLRRPTGPTASSAAWWARRRPTCASCPRPWPASTSSTACSPTAPSS